MAKKKISAETQQELVVAIGARYRAAGKPDKLRILDEFVAVTGYPLTLHYPWV